MLCCRGKRSTELLPVSSQLSCVVVECFFHGVFTCNPAPSKQLPQDLSPYLQKQNLHAHRHKSACKGTAESM